MTGHDMIMAMKWLRRPAPTQRQPNEDHVSWARNETIAFMLWKCKVWGVVFVSGGVLATPFFAGMPAHRYWRWIGTPILIATALSFAALLYFGSGPIWELLDKPRASN
jgi:hypothetical protein